MEFARFIFQDFEHWLGFVIILSIITVPFRPRTDKEDDEDGEL